MIHDSLKINLKKLKKKNKVIGLCHGVFDVLHYGHILHFNSAKKKCDYLIVSITDDKFIKKGPNRPIHNKLERLTFLKQIKSIDHVFVAKGDSAVDSINLIKPDLYFKGADYKDFKKDKTKKIIIEKKAVEKYKGKLVFTNEKQMSSSSIINKLGLSLENDQGLFLNRIKSKFKLNDILFLIENLKKIRTIVIGDMIIDRYIYGSIIGKSGKEPHLVSRYKAKEDYLGGAAAIANHLSDFVKDVKLISDFGNERDIFKFIKSKIKKNVNFKYLKNAQTTIKTRFIDSVSQYKLFGSYDFSDLKSINFKKKLSNKIELEIKKNDVIIVADFSNNFFDKNIINQIRKKKSFLAGMVQKNSNNLSFYNLNNLNNFDLICINEGELRSENKDNQTDIKKLAKKLAIKLKLKKLIVTRGSSGSILLDNVENKVYACPAFNLHPIDKIGAGDSMLAIASIMLRNKINPNIVLLASSIISSLVVDNLGNKYFANKLDLEKNLEHIFK